MRSPSLKTVAALASSLALALLAFASPSRATVKVYDSTRTGGQGGDVLLYVVATCPSASLSVTPGALSGHATLVDSGGGSVTLDSLSIEKLVTFDLDTTAVFGPGAFFFATQLQTDRPLAGQLGTGSTSPLGSVSWGVLSGWISTGLSHCIASPAITCDNNGFQHGATISSQAQSPTYDLGTWSFDAEGDYSAAAYVQQTANGGESNIQWLLRGSYVGASAPALPLVGAGALAAALAVSGIRAATSRRRN